MDAAQGFDCFMLKRLKNVPDEARTHMVELASQPLPLRQQLRLYLRQYLQPNLHLKVPKLEVPRTLHAYLLFETS